MSGHDRTPSDHQDDDWVRAQLSSLPDPELPHVVDERLLTAIRREQVAPTPTTGTSDHHFDSTQTGPQTGRRWLPWAVAASLVMIVGVLVSGTLNNGASPEPVVMAAGVQPVATNTSYTRENIESQVRTHLVALRNQQRVGQDLPAQGRQNTFTQDPQSIDGCLSALTPRAGQVDLLDMADYQGEPSGIVVFRADDEVSVFVVAPSCDRDDPRVRLRLQTSLAAD